MPHLEWFSTSDYKQCLRIKIRESGAGRGAMRELAKAAGCTPSYLSQVLHRKIHLTSDHAANLCRYWELDEEEGEYFMSLVQRGKAKAPTLKHLMDRKLERIRASRAQFRPPAEVSDGDERLVEAEYFSDWRMTAVHRALDIPEFRTPAAISRRLALSLSEVTSILDRLKKHGLAEKSGGKWSGNSREVWAKRGATLAKMNHYNWRVRALDALNDPSDDNVRFAAVHTMSRKSAEQLRWEILRLLERSRNLASEQGEEELYVLVCDFFKL